jgi:hypothetical protein
MKMFHLEDPLEHQRNITEQVRGAAESSKGGRSILEGGLLEMDKETRKANSNIRFQ